MGKMNIWDWASIILLVIGGLNWGLAVFNANLVSIIFGIGFMAKVVYALVGLSAIYTIGRGIMKIAD